MTSLLRHIVFISLPGNDSFWEDLCFSPDVLFFSDREVSEMRVLTGVKCCTMVSTRHYFIMPVQNFFGGAHPQKISGAKNMQNLARFRTTLKCGGECLRNG